MIKELMYKWFSLESLPCESCETLKLQLSIANNEKREMLNTILSFSRPSAEATNPPVDYEKVKPKMATWNVRRQMLEAEDKKAAQLLIAQQKESASRQIADLEKELNIGGVPNA